LFRSANPSKSILLRRRSTDDTPRLLKEAQRQYPWLRILGMARNGGPKRRLERGSKPPAGKIVLTIDVYLQNRPPRELPACVPDRRRQRRSRPRHDTDGEGRHGHAFRAPKKVKPASPTASATAQTMRTIPDSASSLKSIAAVHAGPAAAHNGMHRFLPDLVKKCAWYRGPRTRRQTSLDTRHARYEFRNRHAPPFAICWPCGGLKKRYLRYGSRNHTVPMIPAPGYGGRG